jgi:hypothetical protein
MCGQYASQSGLMLEFRDNGVIVDCGEAHVAKAYTVEPGAPQIVIAVKNDPAPFTLALQSYGTLTGSGSVGLVVSGPPPRYCFRPAKCALCPGRNLRQLFPGNRLLDGRSQFTDLPAFLGAGFKIPVKSEFLEDSVQPILSPMDTPPRSLRADTRNFFIGTPEVP